MTLTRRELFKMFMPWLPGSPPPAVPDGGEAIPGRFTLETLRFLPAAVREKMVTPRSSSRSRMDLLRFGWFMYRFCAALLMEPVRSTSTAYFNCRILLMEFSS